jgi:hypothetical protein
MILLQAFTRLNRWAGPFLLDRGFLGLRSSLGIVAIGDGWLDRALDSLLLYPSTKLISIEVHHQYREEVDTLALPESKSDADDDGDVTRRQQRRRLRILESYVPPRVLAERWDFWFLHPTFKRWLRGEYLHAKYGGPNPTKRGGASGGSLWSRVLRDSPQFRSSTSGIGIGTFSNPLQSDVHAEKTNAASADRLERLPTTDQLVRFLELRDWTVSKDTGANHVEMERLAHEVGGSVLTFRGGALCVPVVHRSPAATNSEVETDQGNGSSSKDDVSSLAMAVAAEKQLSDLSLGELIEVAGGHVLNCGRLNALCERYDAYQIWTQEYIRGLGDYLRKRSLQIQEQDNDRDLRVGDSSGARMKPAVVLDVGAGDGLLIQLLREYLEGGSAGGGRRKIAQLGTTKRRSCGRIDARIGPLSPRRQRNPTKGLPSSPRESSESRGEDNNKQLMLVATDNGSWNIFPRAPVERLSVEQALDKYATMSGADDDKGDGCSPSRRPVIVLCSWMPMDVDWTGWFRHYGVDEYVLIGECDDGQCGHNWETWGNPHFFEDSGVDAATAHLAPPRPHLTPPYEMDGYERVNLDFVAPHQFSRYDSRVSKSGQTVSFRRQRPRQQSTK